MGSIAVPRMNSLYVALLELLARFVSPIIARSILTRALREHDLDAAHLEQADLHALSPRIVAAVRLFVEPGVLEAFRLSLVDLIGELPARRALKLQIRSERDLADALIETRRLCQSWRVRPLTQQKIATVVSELARNIVSYTPGGSVELIPIEGPKPRVLVRATDTGVGIPNIDEIMAGRYRSKTGLGKGLLGSKRLSDRFEVRSGRDGTIVEAELAL
jgi:serine/threonine-protein kinase RsbT